MAGSLARMGEMKNGYKFLVGKTYDRDNFEGLGVDGRLI
jgi:hypothetical protein